MWDRHRLASVNNLSENVQVGNNSLHTRCVVTCKEWKMKIGLMFWVYYCKFCVHHVACDPTSVMHGSTIATNVPKRADGIMKYFFYRICCSWTTPDAQCQVRSAPSHPCLTEWLHHTRTSEQCKVFENITKIDNRFRLAFLLCGFVFFVQTASASSGIHQSKSEERNSLWNTFFFQNPTCCLLRVHRLISRFSRYVSTD